MAAKKAAKKPAAKKPAAKKVASKKPVAKKVAAKRPSKAAPPKRKVTPPMAKASDDNGMPKEGKAAPDFSAADQNGNTVRLSALKGQPVVLYFYPKDDTPGCTVEACDFRDGYAALQKKGAVVLGVSPDNGKSHQKFIAKHQLPFSLLVDESHAIGTTYGTWGEKSMYGRKYMGMFRATFLIGKDGIIQKVWPKVSVKGHVDEVLAAL
jgi:thioredoxin-dependent peroxiredoxin